jgi:hypothetical protein
MPVNSVEGGPIPVNPLILKGNEVKELEAYLISLPGIPEKRPNRYLLRYLLPFPVEHGLNSIDEEKPLNNLPLIPHVVVPILIEGP